MNAGVVIILVVFGAAIYGTTFYPEHLKLSRWRLIYWMLILLRIGLVCLCLFSICVLWIFTMPICEDISGNPDPLAKASSPDGQWSAVVEGEMCHGLMAISDTSEEYWVSLKKKGSMSATKIQINTVNRINLVWRDNHTLGILGISQPSENYGEIHVIYSDETDLEHIYKIPITEKDLKEP